jgi:predicted nucleic acid-binding protein
VFILDTDVLSTMRKTKPHPLVRAWIDQTDAADLSTTVVTVTEIQCGIERQMPSDPAYARQTQAWLDGLLQLGDIHVHPLDVKAALLLGRMHETPALRNFVFPDPRQREPKIAADLAIAAIAIARDAVVATGNQDHFEEIHACFLLPGIYNPFKDDWAVRPAGPTGPGGP